MFKRSTIAAIFALLAAPTMVQAQQTETYAYDVHGRLTGVTRATGSTSQITTYVLDKVDNRTSRAVAAPTSGLMSAPPEATQSRAPAEVQATPQDAQGEDGRTEVAPDVLSSSGGAQ